MNHVHVEAAKNIKNAAGNKQMEKVRYRVLIVKKV